jgi:hypothetical protein
MHNKYQIIDTGAEIRQPLAVPAHLLFKRGDESRFFHHHTQRECVQRTHLTTPFMHSPLQQQREGVSLIRKKDLIKENFSFGRKGMVLF